MADNFYPGLRPFTITTGSASPYFPENNANKSQSSAETPSFQELLRQAVENGGGVEFSKHAAQRIEQRSIEMSADSLQRLNEGVKIAQQKGLDDTLILIDRTAFIVSAQNNKVITTVCENDIKGNVFTNIDGTVIV